MPNKLNQNRHAAPMSGISLIRYPIPAKANTQSNLMQSFENNLRKLHQQLWAAGYTNNCGLKQGNKNQVKH